MKKQVKLIFGIFICILVLIVSYFWATQMMDSVYAYRSPLQKIVLKPGEPLNNSITRSLVIVIIDGLRYDTSLNTEVMPFLNELRSAGGYALMHSRPPSYSQPAYAVLLTGAWPDLNDSPLINLDYTDIPTFTQDDIFSAAHREGLSTAVSGYNWFEKLIPQDSVTVSFYTPGEDQAADRQVTDAALPWLSENAYSLVLIHLDQVDYAGHYEGGAIDPRWNAAATRVDGLLKEIVATMDLNQDTILVVSDHGHLALGGHGGQDADILLEPFVLAGRGIIPGKYADVQMVDVAPTIAAILGTNIPATNQGEPRIEMLDLSKTQLDQINNALKIQQGQLATAYSVAIKKPVNIATTGNIVADTQAGMDSARESRLSNERITRGIIGLVLAIVIINLAAWYAQPYFTWMLGGVVVYLVLFNFKYILIDHKTFSLSSVSSSTDLIASTAVTSVIAFLIGWAFIFLGTKAYRLKPLQAADQTMKFTLVTLAIMTIPIIAHFIMNGAMVTWALPNFLISFIGLLCLIQTLVIAAMGILLTGFSAIIGLFGFKKMAYQVN